MSSIRCPIGRQCYEVRGTENISNGTRLNYILWVQDLIDTTGDDYRDDYDPDRDVVGLDMYFPDALKVGCSYS